MAFKGRIMLSCALFMVLYSLATLIRAPNNNDARRLGSVESVPPNAATSSSYYDQDFNQQISRTNRLIYVHIPKTGGSTIESSSLFDDARPHHRIGGHWTIESMNKDPEKRKLIGYTKATTIRHPCTRFISAFNYYKTEHGNKGDKKWWSETAGNPNDINEFIEMLESSNGGGWDKIRKSRHFWPMVDFVFYPSGEFGINTVMCQEDWDLGLNRLSDALGHPVPSALHTTHKLKLEHKTCQDLPTKSRLALERRYALDYCVFGYKKGGGEESPEYCRDGRMLPRQFTAGYKECMTLLRNDKQGEALK